MTSEDNGDGRNSPIDISIGKEIDRSLGDIISALLKPAATEVGSLLGDSIGLLTDRIRRKRQLNAELGLSEVRKKLEAAHVDMDTLVPPKEEEIYLLVNGLSLTEDESVRHLWAGLFAKILEPGSTISAERSFLSVLGSLSPMDAKIIDFLASIIRADSEIRRKSQEFRPRNFQSLTKDEAAQLDVLNAELTSLRKSLIQEMQERASLFGIDKLSGQDWSDNLLRQGLIERIPNGPLRAESTARFRSFNQREMQAIVDGLSRQVETLKATISRASSKPERILGKRNLGHQLQLEVQFTNFGRRFAAACGLLDSTPK